MRQKHSPRDISFGIPMEPAKISRRSAQFAKHTLYRIMSDQILGITWDMFNFGKGVLSRANWLRLVTLTPKRFLGKTVLIILIQLLPPQLHPQDCAVPAPLHCLSRPLLAMTQYKKKAILAQELLDLGESVPSNWTRTQMEVRLQEIHLANQPRSEQLRKQPNKASSKAQANKASLQTFAKDTLNLDLTYNETLIQLKAKCAEGFQRCLPLSGQDLMNFREHGPETYQQVFHNHPQYKDWCIQTFRKGRCNWRMERFVLWAVEVSLHHDIITEHKKNMLKNGPKMNPMPKMAMMNSLNKKPLNLAGYPQGQIRREPITVLAGSFVKIHEVPTPASDSENASDMDSDGAKIQELEAQLQELRRKKNASQSRRRQ